MFNPIAKHDNININHGTINDKPKQNKQNNKKQNLKPNNNAKSNRKMNNSDKNSEINSKISGSDKNSEIGGKRKRQSHINHLKVQKNVIFKEKPNNKDERLSFNKTKNKDTAIDKKNKNS